MQVIRLRRATGALWEPALGKMARRRVNRRNEGIERLFLAQALNQHSQHMADWVHVFPHLGPAPLLSLQRQR